MRQPDVDWDFLRKRNLSMAQEDLHKAVMASGKWIAEDEI